ncbi:MAG: hypothetical protein P4N59_10820 [Negativicutes bacterium]|nr:hypothetical protein [Negativicutes bacterium]
MFEYVAPYATVAVGPWVTNKTSQIQVFSSRINALDTATISIPSEGVELGSITKGMPVSVEMGYREKGLWPTFSGKVFDVSSGRTVDLYCKDHMEDLRTTFITQTFVNASPQDIVKYGLIKAGVTDFQLGSTQLAKRHHFVASNLNVIQLIKMVNRTWNLTDWAFYFEPAGQFSWGPWEESSRYNNGLPVAILEYGKNLLDLEPSDQDYGTLKTFSLPFIQHSNLLLLRDQRFWDRDVTVRIERIEYLHSETTEMTIEWRIQQN